MRFQGSLSVPSDSGTHLPSWNMKLKNRCKVMILELAISVPLQTVVFLCYLYFAICCKT